MIERLARLEPADETRQRLRLSGDCLTLRRAWPRSAGHLLLEYVDGQGAIVPGQWISDLGELQRVADQTTRRCPGVPPAVLESARVLLQPHGADRRLIGLCPLLARADATLIAHRPERRAVVRLDAAGAEQFAKVVRPSRVRDVVAAAGHLGGLSDRPFAVPEVIRVDPDHGVVIWSRLPGVSLHELLKEGERLIRGARAAGEALRWLHEVPAWPAREHDAGAEIDMLKEQLQRLGTLEPQAHRRLGRAAADVFEALAGGSARSAMIHRDFYDKQVFVDGEGRGGILDFDTAEVGEPALDVANMLVHLQLRTMQKRCSRGLAAAADEAFLAGYGPSAAVRERLGAYGDASRLRLACLYSYRPQWRHLSVELVRGLGAARPASSGSRACPP